MEGHTSKIKSVSFRYRLEWIQVPSVSWQIKIRVVDERTHESNQVWQFLKKFVMQTSRQLFLENRKPIGC